MRIGILTSTETRHRFVAAALRRTLPVVAVGYEQVGYSPANVSTADLTAEESAIVRHHYEERTRQEERHFGHDAAFMEPDSRCAAAQLPPGTLNSEKTAAFFEAAGVDTVVVYGTNLIKPPLLTRWAGRMINLHLGLSPYYRGTATNFYPLLNEEPQYVGATIHLLDAGIDSGPILRHARPVIVADDLPHTIGCKAIAAGVEAMIDVLPRWNEGGMTPTPQWTPDNAKLYLRKDFHPRQVVELYRKLADGLIPRYVARAAELEGQVRLITAGR